MPLPRRFPSLPAFSRLARAAALAALAALGTLAAGCGIGPAGGPADPIAPPPAAPAWRPGEALAMLLRPPSDGAHPVDDDYLELTAPWRVRMAEIDAALADLRRIEKRDRGGRRTWYFDGPDAILLRIDVDEDGTIDQSQYFGPEGLFAIVHRFAGGRRTQRIFWPPGRPRIVEVRDNLPPYPGVWWRSDENPFRIPPGRSG
jgi:hypothetical protein